jgi:hypothetical protein
VIGDIANAIWQMKEDIVPSGRGISTIMMKARARPRSRIPNRSKDDTRFPIFPPQPGARGPRRRCRRRHHLPRQRRLQDLVRPQLSGAQPNTVLLDNALATMGAGLPSAMASAMVYPDRKVMAICGDGGFMMNSQEMETAVRLKLNITVLILNDNSYGMIRWKQANMGFKDWGLTYGNPDFVKYAEPMARSVTASKAPRICRSCSGMPRYAGRASDRLPGRLFRERPDPEQGHQGRSARRFLCPGESSARQRPRGRGSGICVLALGKHCGVQMDGRRMKLQDTIRSISPMRHSTPNTDLEVTDKYSGEVATRVAMADAKTIDKASARRSRRPGRWPRDGGL